MTEIEDENAATIENLNRPDLMAVTSKLITHLDKKSIAGRLQDSDVEKMRDSKTRLLIEAIKTHGSLLRDETLDNIEARLKALEEVAK